MGRDAKIFVDLEMTHLDILRALPRAIVFAYPAGPATTALKVSTFAHSDGFNYT